MRNSGIVEFWMISLELEVDYEDGIGKSYRRKRTVGFLTRIKITIAMDWNIIILSNNEAINQYRLGKAISLKAGYMGLPLGMHWEVQLNL
ncbi:hypothetical protein [Paenibacillus aceris]|uniref:Uncharacterized protein n=1 Tax=Paenibacillus aceris TaxID=869555 RepID=A0ABS4HXK6_9BACL|nr:hypothetical protein [Paenibacillus aceris]